MINFMYMICNVIEELFTRKVGKFQGDFELIKSLPSERKALLLHFKIEEKLIQMLIHAPGNYVGVYTRKGGLKGYSYGKWDCICYHDSCWRQDGVHQFLWEHRENVHFCAFPITKGFDVIETITNAIHVVKLDKVQLDALKQIRKKKYG